LEQEQESRLNFFMSLPYLFTLSREQDDGETYYKINYPDLRGLTIYNDTISAVMAERDDAREAWLRANLKAHEVIPLPRQLTK